MGYWNRDRTTLPLGHQLSGHQGANLRQYAEHARTHSEPLRCWHDDCFPVRKQPTHEHFGACDSREEYAASIFGGIDHLIDLALTSEHYADAIERQLTDTTTWTPNGYAWANWRMGADCEVCGLPA